LNVELYFFFSFQFCTQSVTYLQRTGQGQTCENTMRSR